MNRLNGGYLTAKLKENYNSSQRSELVGDEKKQFKDLIEKCIVKGVKSINIKPLLLEVIIDSTRFLMLGNIQFFDDNDGFTFFFIGDAKYALTFSNFLGTNVSYDAIKVEFYSVN